MSFRLRLRSVLFYILMTGTFFIAGLYLAGWYYSDQILGLEGGATILVWGLAFGGIAFILALFLSRIFGQKVLIKLNLGLLFLLLGLIGYAFILFRQNQTKQQGHRLSDSSNLHKEQTSFWPVGKFVANEEENYSTSWIYHEGESSGMGFFAPDFYSNRVCYFYGDPNFEKTISDHTPIDSMNFIQNANNQFEIATAPPWLVPEVMKLDYDLLYFKIISLSHEFVEIVVNKHTHQTAFVDRSDGKIILWPEFLLSVHSVEFIDKNKEKIHVRPFEASAINSSSYQFLQPIRIRAEWMEVALIDDTYTKVGKGWIRWQRDNKLTVMYNLLS
jgi:hypothetical protein